MSDNSWFFVVGGIALISITYMTIIQLKAKKRKQRQPDATGKNVADNPVTIDQQRALSFGAILFRRQGEKILCIQREHPLNEYIYGLKNQWGITNPVEAKETLQKLVMLKRSNEIEFFLQEPSDALLKIQKEIAKGLDIELNVVALTKSAYAWDICRAVFLAKWCYCAGYLNERETWNIINTASDIAGRAGRNWTDYTVSFLMGRAIHGFDLADCMAESKLLLRVISLPPAQNENPGIYYKQPFKKL